MNWIKFCNYIPFWKRNNPKSKTCGFTNAMYWILCVRNDVPRYLGYDSEIKIGQEFSYSIWYRYNTRLLVYIHLRHKISP